MAARNNTSTINDADVIGIINCNIQLQEENSKLKAEINNLKIELKNIKEHNNNTAAISSSAKDIEIFKLKRRITELESKTPNNPMNSRTQINIHREDSRDPDLFVLKNDAWHPV